MACRRLDHRLLSYAAPSNLNKNFILAVRSRYADILDAGEHEPAKPRDAAPAAARRPRPARTRPRHDSALGAAQSKHPWVRAVDPGTGRAYYFNCRTGLSQWHPPPEMPGERGLIWCRRVALTTWRAAAAREGAAAAAAAAEMPRALRAALTVQRWWRSIDGRAVSAAPGAGRKERQAQPPVRTPIHRHRRSTAGALAAAMVVPGRAGRGPR